MNQHHHGEAHTSQVIRLIPNLYASRRGPVIVGRSAAESVPIFLHQGATDAACGPYSLLMALLALGVLNQDEVIYDYGRRAALARRVKRRAEKYHFSGAGSQSILRILEAATPEIKFAGCTASGRQVRDFALGRLRRGEVVVVGLEYSGNGIPHWVLAVGVSGRETGGQFVAENILLLDPSEDRPTRSAWNNSVMVRPPFRTKQMCDALTRSGDAARFWSAVAIWREAKNANR